MIDQLERDLVLASTGGTTVSAARETLKEGLYTVLVAYTDFGGCRHMVAAAGDAPKRFARATRELARACARLRRGAALFTRAASSGNPADLVHAGRVVSSAGPFLLRAKIALQAAATRR